MVVAVVVVTAAVDVVCHVTVTARVVVVVNVFVVIVCLCVVIIGLFVVIVVALEIETCFAALASAFLRSIETREVRLPKVLVWAAGVDKICTGRCGSRSVSEAADERGQQLLL